MTTTILLTECEQHPWATLTPAACVSRIRKINGEYVRVQYVGHCPECEHNVRESYMKGEQIGRAHV